MRVKKFLFVLLSIALVSCTNKGLNNVETTVTKTEVISDNEKQNNAFTSENSVKLDGVRIRDIEKYGNIVLSISATDFFNAGFNLEDIVTISFLDKKIDAPVCANYFDVDNGEYLLRIEHNTETNVDDIKIAISMGDFATTNGIAVKESTNDANGYRWNYINDADKNCVFTFELKEKGGYHEGRLTHDLKISNNREDYKNLSDEQYANFRMINTSGIGQNKIYRSSSPVNPSIKRNTYAMAATEKYMIKTIVNLADTEQEMRNRENYSTSYYSKQNVIALGLTVDFFSDTFKNGLKEAIHFMAVNDAPYLIHCNEGKDRAGYVSALVECLMGANIDEVTNDYMVTYYNYYNVLPNTEQYEIIKNNNIVKSLSKSFDTEDLKNADLSKLCEQYLLSIGVTKDDIELLKTKLK